MTPEEALRLLRGFNASMKGLIPLPRLINAVLLCAAIALCGCREKGNVAGSATAPAKKVHSYSTSFPRTENPISEGGKWIGGEAAGENLWGNAQSAGGFAFGVSEPTKFGDPTAILTGEWGPTQTATATVRVSKVPTGYCCHEVELRFRTTIKANSITGYEAYCSVMPTQPYCHIARWNGPNGSYWNFDSDTSKDYAKDGDVLMATATGTNPVTITLYKNGEQILQATDTGAAGGGFGAYGPWPSGNPGIGFFDNIDSNWQTFGLSSFSATDGEPQRSR